MKANLEKPSASKPLKVYFYGMNRSEIKPYEKYVQKIEERRSGKSAGLDAKRVGDNHNTVFTMRDNRGNRLVFIRFQVDGEPRLMFIRMMDHKGYNQELFSNQGLKHFMDLHAPQWTDWVRTQDEVDLEELAAPEACSAVDVMEIDWERVDWLGAELIFLDAGHEEVVELPMNARTIISAAAGVGKTLRSLELLEQFCNNAPELQKPFLFLCESLKLKQAAQELWLAKGRSLERVHFKTLNDLLKESIEECHLVGEEDFQLWLQGYIDRYKKQRKNPEVIQVDDTLLDKPRELYAEIKRIAGLSEQQYKDLGTKECYFHQNNEKAWIFKACCDYKNTLHPLKQKPELKFWLERWIAEYRMTAQKKTEGIRLSEAFLRNTASILQECEKAMTQGFAEYQNKPSKLSVEEKKWIIDACKHYKQNKVHPAFYDPALKQSLKDRYTCAVVDEAQRCSLNQLELAAAIAEQGCFYLMDTNQITDANASVHDGLRKWLREHFPEQCRTIELSPSCYRCHPLILDCFLNPVLKTKGQHCGVDYKGKYSQVNAANLSEETEHIFSRIESLDDTSLKTLQAMTASCSFAVLVANEDAWHNAVKLFGEACVYRTQEVGGLEFDQVLLFDCFNQPGLASLAKLLQECQSKEELHERVMESGTFHRAAPGMEGREDVVLFLNNLYLAASRAKKGLHLYQPPSRACDRVMKGLQDNGMPKETRPVFAKLEASTDEEWRKHMVLLIKGEKIEKAWSIYQAKFGKSRKTFDVLCVDFLLEEENKAEQKPVAVALMQQNALVAAPEPVRSEPVERQKAEPVSQTKLQPSKSCGKRKHQAPAANEDRLLTKQTQAPKAPNLIEELLDKKDFSTNPYKCLYEKDHQGLSLLDLIHQKDDKGTLLRRCYEKAIKHVSGTRKEKEVERVHLAVLCGQLVDLKKCLSGNLANDFGKHQVSPLYIAAQYNYLDVVSHLILKCGAKVNTQQLTTNKDTALHVAAEKGHVKMVDLLQKLGADESLINQQGKTPMLMAQDCERWGVVNLFSEYVSKKATTEHYPPKKSVSGAVQYRKPPYSLQQLCDALERKKIPFDCIENNEVLIFYLKTDNMLPTEKELNGTYTNNESGWYHLLYCAQEHADKLLRAFMETGICPSAEALAACHISNNANVWNWLANYNECMPVFKTLLKHGIIPDAKALSVCCTEDNTNAWFWLAGDSERLPVFKALLEKGIVPDAKDLSICSTEDNTNAWFWLAFDNESMPILKSLLEKGIVPDSNALSVRVTTDNINAWYWLAFDNGSMPIFKSLLEKGIVPDSKALSACYALDNTNAWFKLAGDNESISVFKGLLERGIIPDAKTLSICCTEDNTNTWFWLAGNNERTPAFKALLEQGIVPDCEALSTCRTEDNSNTWFWLARDGESITVFQALLEKDIVPDSKTLSVCCNTDNTSAWYWLSGDNQCITAFQALLEKGIVPDAKTLSTPCTTDNTNAWFKFASSRARMPVFKALLEKGIVPDAKDLSICRTTDNLNTWHWLACNNETIPVFMALLEKGIVPDAKALSNYYTKYNINVWRLLAADKARIPVFETLLEKCIVPDVKDLSICCTTDNTNVWHWLASTSISLFRKLLAQNILPDDSCLEEPNNIWCMLSQTDADVEIVEHLLNSGRAPQKEITLKTMIENIQSRHARVEHPLINRLNQLLANFKKEEIDVNSLISLSVFNRKNDETDGKKSTLHTSSPGSGF